MIFSRNMFRLVLIIIALGYIFILQGAYINKIEVDVPQPDGTVLNIFASGDEYHNWLHDENNFTIIADATTGYYCYAEQDGELVKAGSLIVGRDNPQNRNLHPGINISRTEYRRLRQTKFFMPAERNAPTTGTINNIVIYIRFSDETEFGEPISTYDGWFNSNANSQHNYFLEASYNQLTVNTSFYPNPLNNYVVSWQDSQPRAYYQPYNATTNPIGYDGDTARRLREFSLLQNATNGVSAQIPSSLVIDSDGDGRVDNVVYIVRGAAGAWSSLLWPHRWALYDRYVYINGKRVYDFNFQLQTFLVNRSVGVICHEFFHTLGAPDLYHYTDDGISPAGSWDLMCSDTNPPQHMTAFMKYKYGNWISSIPTVSADQTYTLNPLTSATGNAYRLNSQDPSQYYIVEFRKKTGTFESSIPGSGLIVYRIDTTAGNGNADGPPDELYVYRPGGTTTVNGTPTTAHFSSETGRTSFNSTTNPTPFLRDGTSGNLYLCEIGPSAGTTMSFRKGIPKIDFSINPYSQGFEGTAFPPEAWTTQSEVGSYVFQRVTSGSNPFCLPTGTGMARYNSDIAPSGNSALLVTPMVECSDTANYGYQISFFMYRDEYLSTYQDKIEIYVNTLPDLTGNPISLGTIYRNRLMDPVANSSGWYQYTFTIPVNTIGNYYTIFRAVSANGYNMFIDTVKIARVPLAAINPVPSNNAARVPVSQNFSWQSTGSSPTGYKFYLGTNNPPTNLLNGIDLGNVLSYDYSVDLQPNTAYFWKIVPYNAGGNANDCPVWSFTTIPHNDLMAVSLFGSGYALSGENLTCNLTVKNNGALPQNSYLVRLMSDDSRQELAYELVNIPLAGDATAVHTLTWNPDATGQYSVYGEVSIAGDENIVNNITTFETACVYPETHFMPTVGDALTALTANTMPFNFYWKNSISETVYLASELQMTAGTIVGIVFVNNFVQDLVDKPVKLWLKNTDAINLSASWLSFDGYALVYDDVIDFPAGVNEIFIPMDTPFVYNGNNLAVRCNRPMDTVYFNSANHFLYNSSTANPNRSRYLYSDSVTYDPTAPSAAGTLSSSIPMTGFIVENAVPLALAAPEAAVSISEGNVELTWNRHPGYYGYHIYASDNPYNWPETPSATVFTPSFSDIAADRKFYKVVAFSYDYGFRSLVEALFGQTQTERDIYRQQNELAKEDKD